MLEANRLLRSPDEAALFEQTLEKLAQNPEPADLPSLHLILDDACKQPEVMFGLVHFLESFEVQEQVRAFIQVMPDLVKRAAEWTAILHSRIMNDDVARSVTEHYPPKFIRAMLDLTDEQVSAALSYIEAHRTEVEAEYQLILREAEELRQYYEEENRERLARIAAKSPKPGTEAIRAKLQAKRAKLESRA